MECGHGISRRHIRPNRKLKRSKWTNILFISSPRFQPINKIGNMVPGIPYHVNGFLFLNRSLVILSPLSSLSSRARFPPCPPGPAPPCHPEPAPPCHPEPAPPCHPERSEGSFQRLRPAPLENGQKQSALGARSSGQTDASSPRGLLSMTERPAITHKKRAAPFVRDSPIKDGNVPLF